MAQRKLTKRGSERREQIMDAGYRLFAEEGLSADVASGGELHMALAPRAVGMPHRAQPAVRL